MIFSRGGEIGGAGGASAPPLGKQGGLSPLFITSPYYKSTATYSSVIILDVCDSAQVKIATKSAKKLLPECIRNALRESKFPKFSDPLGGLWAYAHSLTVVTVKGLSPPTFVTCSPPLFRPMCKGGCDVKSGKRCLHYYCVRCTLLVMYL